MSTASISDVLQKLRDFEQRAIAEANRAPAGRFASQSRRGIGFRLGTIDLAAPISDIREILNFPLLYAIPGAKAWVRGIANARGRPLTVVDLPRFFGQPPIQVTRKTRLLVAVSELLSVGLTVDEVFGFVELSADQTGPVPGSAPDWIRPYLKGGCPANDKHWALMDFPALLRAPEFLRAAA
jgi:twitching motility protein PilI